jgi:hypothetical protein
VLAKYQPVCAQDLTKIIGRDNRIIF